MEKDSLFDEPIEIVKMKLKLAEKTIEAVKVRNLKRIKLRELEDATLKEEELLKEVGELSRLIDPNLLYDHKSNR